MSPVCPLFAIWWSSLLLTDLHFPGLSTSFLMVDVSNVTCSRVHLVEGGGTFNSSRWSVSICQPSNIVCSAVVTMGAATTTMTVDLSVLSSELSVEGALDDQCMSTQFSLERCNLNVKVNKIGTAPKVTLFEVMKPVIKKFIEEQAEKLLCYGQLPTLGEKFVKSTVRPEKPSPANDDCAMALNSSAVLRGVSNAVNNIPLVRGAKLTAQIPTNTTFRFNATLVDGMVVNVYDDGELSPAVRSLLTMIKDALKALSYDSFLGNVTQMLSAFNMTTAMANVPDAFSIYVDMSLRGLWCDEPQGLHCTIPCSDAVSLQNLRTVGLGDWDKVINNNADELVLPRVVDFLNSALASNCSSAEDRQPLPLLTPVETRDVPPMEAWIPATVLSIIIFVCGITWSVRCHRRNPALLTDGSPISLRRALLEDGALLTVSLVAAVLLLWSNTTTAATLVFGGEVDLLSFCLKETTSTLSHAGLGFFAVIVFFFSGVYPYIKLFCILLCTVILQKPGHVVMEIMEYSGKFSFIDTFAMVVMAGGLDIHGVADVRVRVGFYLFLLATILTIIAGNYAMYAWRHNTSVRNVYICRVSSDRNAPTIDFVEMNDDEHLNREGKGAIYNKVNILLFALRGVGVVCATLCVVFMWFIPCLHYTVGGIASIIQPEPRDLTMFDLTSATPVVMAACLLTTTVVPILFAAMYPKYTITASWCAADALAVACLAGLLQLGNFVDFILGGGMEAVYTANAQLLWPMWLVITFSIFQWIAIVEYLFSPLRRLWRRCKLLCTPVQ